MESNPKDRNELSSQECQAAYIRKINAEAKEAKTAAIFIRVYGGVLLVGIIYIWYLIYHMSLIGGLGIITGLILAGIFAAIYPGGVNPKNKTHKYVILIFGGGIIFLLNTPLAKDFIVMLFCGAVSAACLFGSVKGSHP